MENKYMKIEYGTLCPEAGYSDEIVYVYDLNDHDVVINGKTYKTGELYIDRGKYFSVKTDLPV